ncbi:MAG TPA: S8 family peptidase [Candidatus Kryptonia bacterium]
MKAAFAVLILLYTSSLSAQNKYWVFFSDKPGVGISAHLLKTKTADQFLVSKGILSQRAIIRRLKVLSEDKVVSSSDFPVSENYVDGLKSEGFKVIGESRWFNAAVVVSDSSSLYKLRTLPFVNAYRRIQEYSSPIQPKNIRPFSPLSPSIGSLPPAQDPGDSTFYGPSQTQLELSGVPQVHALGINGKGVLVGMLDAGFRYEGHDALEHIKIIGEHDFIQNDSITANQAGDSPDQDNHGTSTLSMLGAYSPGNDIGVAYGSEFMLAKTEYVPVSDFKWEEDNWVEGIEWMEARGVDVVSSSVGYDTFVDSSGAIDSSQSYFWSRGDFNGRRSIASEAATRAAELGVVVVQAAGNEGNGDGETGTLLVPGDADSIITVGAVDFTGQLASFSSTGPTSDGRIKPDLVADGSGDYVAVVPGPDTYAYESGTSFATPLTAGIAALILSVRPNYTPSQVIDLLKTTADKNTDTSSSLFPNDFYGWGIVNAWSAVRTLGFVGSNDFTYWVTGTTLNLAVRAYASKGINLAMSNAYYSSDGAAYSAEQVFRTDTANQFELKVPVWTSLTKDLHFYFDLVDSDGTHLNIPYRGLSSPFQIAAWELNPIPSSDNYFLFTNYPNPFSSVMHVSVDVASNSNAEIVVFDILGRRIKTIFKGSVAFGLSDFTWNGINDKGVRVSSGTYFIRVNIGGQVSVLKALFLK